MSANLTQRLDLRQSQNLVMTPQLQQAIKLLQMNNAELNEFVEEELAQNPLLEKAEPEGGTAEPMETPAQDTRDGVGEEFDEAWTGNEAESKAEPSGAVDFDLGTQQAGSGGNRSFEDSELSLENTLSRQTTLREHLHEQMLMAFNDPKDRLIGGLMIEMLDESGYLRLDIDVLAERLGAKKELVRDILDRLQQFDPPGIFAGSLAECLKLQLDEQGQLDEPMEKLLAHLPLLGSHDYEALCRICGVNQTYLMDMIAEIKSLNPRPASLFEHMIVQMIVPDVVMKAIPKSEGGGWRVELNSDTLPRVLVNQEYVAEISAHAKDKKSREYLNEQLNSANWLIRALDQRAKTILKVASEIIEQQEPFFLYGIEFLQPLTLKDIAEKIDMHESTVSRVTSNKYIGTPRGLFELKYFFSTAITSADGSVHSAEAIRMKIKALIDAEKPEAILSDDAIVEILQKDKIDIARRTVAKYRESLNIPSSVQRRRIKRSQAGRS
ncbi:MAG: RNA polymerase factor sigma-54 [Micavibrio aeruginosavorus]|uniref:RNA polymerase factor sigma-54 n=1 Tax=Micavibrio aeruginosavorus TaxID=349221 RepID=A0A7T5R298_9BACT|nr:MAG: RNA polymerase factor sigma-54 [Micavibrio aeruginosavorus]